jgi:hypothetical protein
MPVRDSFSSVEYDKTFATLSAVNEPLDSNEATPIDNLIHEAGRLQLNTYQTFVRNIMNPRSEFRSLLLVHMTGTGKTITAVATATEYVRQFQPNAPMPSIGSVIVLGFTRDIFKKELMTHPEFTYVNSVESQELKELEQRMHDSPAAAELYHATRGRYQRRLLKREYKGIYKFYGYRQLTSRVINFNDVKAMMTKNNHINDMNSTEFDPFLVKKWIESGDVRIDTDFIRGFARSLIICDEIHNVYTGSVMNTYGIAIQIVFDYFFKTLKPNDADYGSIRSLLLSATPLTTSAAEIIPVITLLTGDELKESELFQQVGGVDQLTVSGASKIRQGLSGRVSYIMDDNPKEYPSSSFTGSSIKGIDYIRFIRSSPVGHQRNSITKWSNRGESLDDRGTNMIKDITFPALKEFPNGVFFSKYIAELENLPPADAVRTTPNGFLSSNILHADRLGQYSCKYETLVRLCTDMKGVDHGKLFIYHPFIQGSGVELICSILIANGFVCDGDLPVKNSICMKCDATFGSHPKDHPFTPVQFVYAIGTLSKSVFASRLAAYNSDANIFGERIKIVIGSKAMREGHTLKACRHVIIAHEPSSISEMIQIIGRAVRKHVHSMLPPAMRSVQIHVLTTDISSVNSSKYDPGVNEEHAYKLKVLQFAQINRVERIMYDVSIDYLINFRFKLRETPPMLGDAYSLDWSRQNAYEKTLTSAYKELRNGITPSGIHTNRFNIFYFEGEVKLVSLIIKRILLDHYPAIKIDKLKEVIRGPPFYIEYNTKLISDDSIAVCINKLCFRRDKLRVIVPPVSNSFTDTVFDQSSDIIDRDGRNYRILCIGHPLCNNAYLVKRLVSSIIEGDNSIIDTFRKSIAPIPNNPIDLKDLADRWSSTISIDDILDDIKKDSIDAGLAANESSLTNLPIGTHIKLAEWVIELACARIINKRRVSISDMTLAKYLADYYRSKRLLVIVSDLKHTRLYNRLRQYDVDNGTSWCGNAARASGASMPIGHLIDNTIRVYQPSDNTWNDLKSISDGITGIYPYGVYIFEERIPGTLNVILKLRYPDDKKAKGITMGFCPKADLEKISKLLKIDIRHLSRKEDIINRIESAAWVLQSKIYPKRLIYRLVDM